MGPRRHAFTLVEMLVSLALVLFIMTVLSEAFVTALESFRQLKAVGDLNGNLRGATGILRQDLRADHFGTGLTLSQQNLAPPCGFFRLWQGKTSYPTEGTDANGIPCRRATDHMLHFSVRLTGNRRESFFPALVGNASFTSPLTTAGPAAYRDGQTYHSQWAEVVYFLRPNGTTTAGPVSTPLYGLYRRQLVVVSAAEVLANGWNTTNRIAAANLSPNHVEVSCHQDPLNSNYLYLNGEDDLPMPVSRFGMQPLAIPSADDIDQPEHSGLPFTQPDGTTSYPKFSDDPALQAKHGDDLLVNDVVSFDVQVSAGGDFVDLAAFDNTVQSGKNPKFSTPGGPRVFDTWGGKSNGRHDYSSSLAHGYFKSAPLNVSIRALQITIRVWDFKTQRTRQVTIVQDM